MAEELAENGSLKDQIPKAEGQSQPPEELDEEGLEELEPEDTEKGNGFDDFFSQDPVELDEAAEENEGDTGSTVDVTRGSDESKGPNEEEKRGEDSEAVTLDEPDEVSEGQDSTEGRADEGKDVSEGRTGAESSTESTPYSNTNKVSFFKKNKVLIGVMGFGLMFVLAGVFIGARIGHRNSLKVEQEDPVAVSDPVVQENLASFFVPLNGGKEGALMAKIDFVVNWTRLCGIRFKESRYEIRGQVYHFLRRLLKKGINPQKEKSAIKDGATQVLNNSLGVTGVKISAMEVELI